MSQDYIALEWVKGEIEETLQQAQQALEAYVESPEDKSRLKFCLSYLHQIHGTLQMVEFYGAALLAEEMEAVASALTAGSLPSERQGLEILMQAIIQLPHYLEHVKVGRRDLPVVLLPILNELRSARGEALLSETALFAPTIRHNPPLTTAQANAIGSDDFGQWIRKVRQMLQTATLQLLQGKQVDVAKEYLARAFARLHKTLGHTPQGLVWLPALAFAEWLQKQQHLPNSARQLLRQLDVLLKDAIEQGADAINTPAPSELIKNLLFYVARTEVRTDAIRTVQEQFQLRQALPTEEEIQQERDALAGPDRATVGHVLGALVEEIAAIKDRFDLLVRSDDDRIATLSDLTANLKQLSDTLGMLGLGMPRKVMQDQQAAVNAMLAAGTASDDELLEIAGALLYVEATLSGMQSEGDLTLGAHDSSLNDAQKAVIREARNVIEQVKDAVVAYVGNQWAVHELEAVPDLLRSVAGSMTMIPLPRVATVLANASAFVQNELIAKEVRPQWSVMDTFADALSSTEYYLERYSDNPNGASDELLARAEHALAGVVNREVTAADSVEVAAKADVETPAPSFDDVATAPELLEQPSNIELETVAFESNADEFAGGENLPALEIGDFSEAEAGAEEEIVLQDDSSDLLLDVIDHVDHSDSIEFSVENILPEIQANSTVDIAIPTKPAAVAAIAEDDDDLIDDEIIEIFIEEAGEVNETLDEYWPQFKANLDDNEALITVRRAFHTLKGSGRMVKAEFIGELAWSIENMFNRVLDSTIELSPELFALVDHVISQLPTLIDDFRLKQPASFDVEPLKAYAHALAAGEAVGPLTEIIGQVPAAATVAKNISDIELIADVDFEPAESEMADLEFEPLADVDLEPIAVVETDANGEREELAAAMLVEDEDDDEDDALLEIFDGEARTHLQTVNDFVQLSRTEDYLNPLSDQVQRALHTLKGSAYMAGINCIAHVAAPLEKLIKELRLYQIRNSRSVVEALAEGSRLIGSALNDRAIIASESIPGSKPYLETLAELEQELLADIDPTSDERRGPNPQAIARFMEQGMDSLLDADRLLSKWQHSSDRSILQQLQADLQDVSGGAAEAELPHVQVLAEALDQFYQRACDESATPDAGMIELAAKAHEALLGMLDCLAAGQETEHPAPLLLELEGWQFVTAAANADVTIDSDDFAYDEFAIEEVTPAISSNNSVLQNMAVGDTVSTDAELLPLNSEDEELLEIFLEEAQEISESVETALLKWRDAPDDLLHVAQLQRELHTLKGGARMAEIAAVADLCHELETLYENINDGRLGVQPNLFDLLDRAHDELGTQLDQVRAGKLPQPAKQMMHSIRQYLTGEVGGDILEISDDATDALMPTAASTPALQTEALDESDREILEIFLEEANELQEALDSALHGWEQEPDDKAGPEEAQRVLHTLKGGARLSGLTRIGDLAHDFETEILHAQQGQIERDAAFFKLAYQRQDELAQLIDEVAKALSGEALIALSEPSLTIEPEQVIDVPVLHDEIDVLEVEADAETESTVAEDDSDEDAHIAASNNVVPLRPAAKTPTPTKLDKAAASPQQQRPAKAPQELVKVSADLLDNLVNLAGETSIGRGRLEQQVTDFSHTLEEMEMTLDRLRDQLRRLDMETEAQVVFRQERQGPAYEDFDPLEMDRYSTLQQLSRSLVESASDLFDLKETLTHKTRDAETLLLQQSRINTELQEGLMKTRMVPFNRLVPRLRRIVRQVGQELGKQVELRVYNADGEMDRTILERMISPLEHMVRNAVDHGIENREQRSASGKSAIGYIDLEISRDGGDVLITMTDDGRGVNMAAVRKKAIERGLMSASDDLTDQEILQFILHAGFSTAEAITQISGRGVGMDVVASEIKQMGGSVDIQSEAGVGTRFIVRLPFTVSVNRALMVKVGDDLYAVPLNNIQGIVRVPVSQMQALYAQPREQRSYTYASTDYRIEYLGEMLENEASPKFTAQSMPVPVLLVRGSTPFALQVDTLLGSREIVVKTLGPQFAGVRGVSGGTILGDGSVVIILDLPAMIRTQASLEYQHARALDHKEAERRHELENRLPRILVVDDSVTVRKVTSRLLERNGMEVFTAKDGVDAMTTLQDHKPDLMLLDIEMPRMDGFEVASLVRHDSRLKDIPIIMITSRTGDKHRERAMSIGVNEYLGKPFQEDILLATMNRLLGRGDI